MGLVYIIENNINNKCYVGMTIKDDFEERINQHVRDAKNKSKLHLHRAIRKHGIENFTWFAYYIGNDIEFIRQFEIAKIKELNSFNNGYNMTLGGEGSAGYKHSKEHKENISKTLKGNEILSNMCKNRIGKDNPNSKKIILIHPDGKEEIFNCMVDACRKYNILSSKLTIVAQSKRNHTSGFKCKYL